MGFDMTDNGSQMLIIQQLFSEENVQRPIAHFERDAQHGGDNTSPAKLVLENIALPLQDLVVVSYLLLERSARFRGDFGKDTSRRAAGPAANLVMRFMRFMSP